MSYKEVGKKVMLNIIKAHLDSLRPGTLARIVEIATEQTTEYHEDSDIYRIYDKEPPF